MRPVHDVCNLWLKLLLLRFQFISYNPTLTYGKARDPPKPIVQPHFTMFEGKCLSFDGFTIQTVTESSVDTNRVRRVKITYFLVDDSISVVEPVVEV